MLFQDKKQTAIKATILSLMISMISGCGWMKYTEEFDNKKDQSSVTAPILETKKAFAGSEFVPNGFDYQNSFVQRYKVSGSLGGFASEIQMKSLRGYRVYTSAAGVVYSDGIVSINK